MGIAASKNKSTLDVLNEALTETVSDTVISISQSSTNTAQPTQKITITGSAARDFNVSGVTQKVVLNIDSKKFLSQMTESNLKSLMRSSLEAAAKDNQAIEHGLTLGAAFSSNESAAGVRNKNVNRIVNSYNYSQFVNDVNEVTSLQTIDISARSGRDVNVSDISQDIKAEIIASQIVEHMVKAYSDIESENKTSVTKETTQSATSGISLGWIAFGFIIFIAIAAAVAVYFWSHGGKEIVQQQLSKSGQGSRRVW